MHSAISLALKFLPILSAALSMAHHHEHQSHLARDVYMREEIQLLHPVHFFRDSALIRQLKQQSAVVE